MRDRALTTDEQVLARATKLAVQAHGGLEDCARETGTGPSQLSRCCNPNLPDSITIRDAVAIEASNNGRDGHPHILRAMARLLNFVLVPVPVSHGPASGLLGTLADLTGELGDVARSIGEALADDDVIDAAEARRVLDELHQMDTKSAALRVRLDAIVENETKGVRA